MCNVFLLDFASFYRSNNILSFSIILIIIIFLFYQWKPIILNIIFQIIFRQIFRFEIRNSKYLKKKFSQAHNNKNIFEIFINTIVELKT
jgi:hypothetical protein